MRRLNSSEDFTSEVMTASDALSRGISEADAKAVWQKKAALMAQKSRKRRPVLIPFVRCCLVVGWGFMVFTLPRSMEVRHGV
jgi:hypothetical protein